MPPQVAFCPYGNNYYIPNVQPLALQQGVTQQPL